MQTLQLGEPTHWTLSTQTSRGLLRHSPASTSAPLTTPQCPTNKPVLTRSKPVVRQVKVWPAGGADALLDCFEITDWSVFKEAATGQLGVNVKEYAEAVSGYIQKCTEDICVTKDITVRANQKPWLTNEVRSKLRARNTAFRFGNETALRSARADLNRAIRDAKHAHSKKIEGHFQDCKDAR